ncbi:Uncharacterised protein [Salmonella enterica subsp. enterica serovar Sanjuan]|uniref:Uncharacterized protein n=1 Tax=Salmonella enterica subsp. enterica serovar Sanjuan TaxID=1160765 RepID=A0A3S4IQX3_SALET|nr:Uncharacterised protein [Salmonella enterica subsp. enterica serovar Sanjuan]
MPEASTTASGAMNPHYRGCGDGGGVGRLCALALRFHIVAQVSFHDARDVLEFDILLDNRQRYRVEYL